MLGEEMPITITKNAHPFIHTNQFPATAGATIENLWQEILYSLKDGLGDITIINDAAIRISIIRIVYFAAANIDKCSFKTCFF
jgi:hypothetical protein